MLKTVLSLLLGLALLIGLAATFGGGLDTRQDYAACEVDAFRSKVQDSDKDAFMYSCMLSKGNRLDRDDPICAVGPLPACFERGWWLSVRQWLR